MTDHRMDINVRQEETYMKEIIAKRIEEMAVYLAKNSSSRSVPYFVYKVKEPEGIEAHIQRLETKIE